MTDLRRLVTVARELRALGDEFVVATVVGARGSTYRRPGARMIATNERWVAGSVSGGAIEGELLRKIRWQLHDKRALVATYDSSDEDAQTFGVGCNGAVDVLQEIATAERTDPLVLAERCIAVQRRGAVATVVQSVCDGVRVGDRVTVFGDESLATLASAHVVRVEALCRDALATGRPARHTIMPSERGSFDVFVEAIQPPPRLFVFGAGHDILPVVSIGRTIGWEVIVCAPTPHAHLSLRDRFADADELLLGPLEAVAERVAASACPLAVVMSHDYERDMATLAMLLRSRAEYIGVLGPRARTAAMLAEVRTASDTRVHSPVGLAIGAETPEQIALAIVAEAQAVVARTSGLSLREQPSGIHRQEVA